MASSDEDEQEPQEVATSAMTGRDDDRGNAAVLQEGLPKLETKATRQAGKKTMGLASPGSPPVGMRKKATTMLRKKMTVIRPRSLLYKAASKSQKSASRFIVDLGNIKSGTKTMEDEKANANLLYQVRRSSMTSRNLASILPISPSKGGARRSILGDDGGFGMALGVNSKRTSITPASIAEDIASAKSDDSSSDLSEEVEVASKNVGKFRIVMDADTADYRWIIDWDNPFRRAWDVAIVVAVIYMCFTVPLQIAFVDFTFNKSFGTFLDVIFAIDIILNFRTGFIHDGQHEKNPRKVAKHYLESWFFVDILASIPFELFFGAGSKTTRKSLKILKWLKIPKLLRVGRIFKYLRRYIKFYRLFVLGSLSALFVHLFGCFWLTIVEPCVSLEEGEVAPTDSLAMYECDRTEMWQQYLLSLRISFSVFFLLTDPFSYLAHVDRGIWEEEQAAGSSNATADSRRLLSARKLATNATTAATEVGLFGYSSDAWSDWSLYSDDRRVQITGLIFLSVGGMCIGFGLSVSFIAESVVFAVNRMSTYYEFYNRVDRIKREMLALHLPEEIQYRVSRYYDYLWINQKMGLNDEKGGLLRDPDLSLPLRKEIALLMHGPLLSQVSLFRDCSTECRFRLAMCLSTHVYLPGDVVFNKGDLARELYIIRKGVIAVRFAEVDPSLARLSGKGPGVVHRSELDAEARTMADSGFSVDETLQDSETVRLMGPGSFFGEIALLTSLPRSCSVLSKTVSELNKLSKTDFERCMLDFPELNDDIAQEVIKLYPGLRDRLSEFLASAAVLRDAPASPRYTEDQQAPVTRHEVQDIVQDAIERLVQVLGGTSGTAKLHAQHHPRNRISIVSHLVESTSLEARDPEIIMSDESADAT